MVKVVYCFDASSMVICQKPTLRSRQGKHPAHPSFLWLPVIGEVDRSLSWFWHLAYESKSKNTSTTALHHGLWLGLIAPTSNICFICAQTSSTIGGGSFGTSPWRVHHQQPWSHDSLSLYSPTLQVTGKRCHDTQLTGLRHPPDFCLTNDLGQINPAAERTISSSAQLSS